MNAVATIASVHTAPAPRNATCDPCSRLASRLAPAACADADCDASTVTNTAVPTAPATCWTVPTIAEPCEYRLGGRDPRAMVNSGVNMNAKQALITMWQARMSHQGVVN